MIIDSEGKYKDQDQVRGRVATPTVSECISSTSTRTSSKFSITLGLPRASWEKKNNNIVTKTYWFVGEDVSSQ